MGHDGQSGRDSAGEGGQGVRDKDAETRNLEQSIGGWRWSL